MNLTLLAQEMTCATAASLVLLIAFCFPCLCTPVPAQSIDYGALEQLFKEPVTTSVDGSAQRVSDVAATMEIITPKTSAAPGPRIFPASCVMSEESTGLSPARTSPMPARSRPRPRVERSVLGTMTFNF
jgi:hypothetical protein